jgi:monomeric sarcosine oxidase
MTDGTFDTIIVGGGVMGCAAAYHLARRGQKALVVEQYRVGNLMGSSHGASRLFRLIHAEVAYIRLAQAAYAAWQALEADSGERLLQKAGGYDLGPAGALEVFRRAMQTAGVPYELLERDEIVRRYPIFKLPEGTSGLYQEDYCLIAADRTVATLAAQAKRYGAKIVEEERVGEIVAMKGSVAVGTDRASYSGEQVILSAGSWMRPLVRQVGLDLPLRVTKEMVAYYRVSDPAAFMPGRFPLFREHLGGEGARWGVGFPIFNHPDVKITMDCSGPVVAPGDLDRSVEKAQMDLLRAYVARTLPGLGEDISGAEACRYTMTPDDDFILDRHPAHPEILVASPCSGHGFKFSVLIGEILADLAMHGATEHPIERFRLDRPGLQEAAAGK